MFYHESLVCVDRSPIEWLKCYRGMPVYVSSGFDLAVDDCHLAVEKGFRDYGQCERFNETIDSGWWERHRQSLASRQLFSYSLGLGWSFTAWKLYDGSSSGSDDGITRIIDVPARLLCLRDVVEADLMPSLKTGKKSRAACLNGPKNDFAMGDATFSPTPSPPPLRPIVAMGGGMPRRCCVITGYHLHLPPLPCRRWRLPFMPTWWRLGPWEGQLWAF